MKKALLISILMLAILATATVPTYAFVLGPNPATDDGNYELYGPHVKGINIIVYADTTAMWTAMNSGTAIDIEDWPLDQSWVTLWSPDGGPFTVVNYGGEAGYYLLDLNNNLTFSAAEAGPYVHNPTSELILREALAYAVNRSDMVSLSAGLAIPIYTPVPKYMAGYINTDISPLGSKAALTYGGLDGNTAAAIALLNGNGYTIDGSGWRIDSVSQGGTGAELNLLVYSRAGLRGDFCDDYVNVLQNVLKIKCTYVSHVPRSTCNGPVFEQHYFNIYTGGWIFIGPDPDYLCDLYNGSNYYYPGTPNNYDGIDYPDLNGNLTTIKLAPTIGLGTQATLDAQLRFAEHAASIPLWSQNGLKDYQNTAVANAGTWKDMVNTKGVGVNSWWDTLDMKQAGNLYPNAFAYYGFSSTVQLQNMIYSTWYWDQEVLGRIYDGGAARDPYTLASWVPQLYKSWAIGTWKDAHGEIKTAMNITLRPDVYWQDGQPVTTADVYYTLVQMSKDLLAKSMSAPWWYPTVQYMRSVEVIDDYNMQILLDVNSVWAVGWVIGSVVLPMHIWKPIVDNSVAGSSNPRNADATTPDPYLIGSGPYRWYSGIGTATGQTIVMVANSPGSSAPNPSTGLTPVISPGYYFYNPVYVDINPPGGLSKVNISPTANFTTVPITITLRNMDTHDSLIVSKYVYVNGVLNTTLSHTGITLDPMLPWNSTYMYPSDPLGHADVETLSVNLSKKTLYYIKVAVNITGPSTLGDPQANPWTGTWVNVTLPIWVTITKDIAGSDLFKEMTPVDSRYNFTLFNVTVPQLAFNTTYQTAMKTIVPAPDLKVDGKDINQASLAFGTVPGDPRWNAVADVNHDYKVDGADVALIALNFGY